MRRAHATGGPIDLDQARRPVTTLRIKDATVVTQDDSRRVLHGDVFDTITKNFVFLAHLGDWGYRLLLRINRLYNAWRAWRGKEYWSLSKAIKARVKSAVSHVSDFENHIAQLARERGCVGAMCGHIHTAADKMIGDIHYLNSGDWVESLTAVVEHWDGRYELVRFEELVRQFPVEPEEPILEEIRVEVGGELPEWRR